MKRIAIFTLSMLACMYLPSHAQDFDLHVKKPNDGFRLPQVPAEMGLEEFQLLSRTVRMRDMAYAMVVPGYVHFRTFEPGMGYTLLGARLLGYSGWAVLSLNSSYQIRSLVNVQYKGSQVEVSSRTQTYQALLFTASALVLGSYFFDIIRGHTLLQNKQERIRYKYAIKPQLISYQNKNYFSMAVGIRM